MIHRSTYNVVGTEQVECRSWNRTTTIDGYLVVHLDMDGYGWVRGEEVQSEGDFIAGVTDQRMVWRTGVKYIWGAVHTYMYKGTEE